LFDTGYDFTEIQVYLSLSYLLFVTFNPIVMRIIHTNKNGKFFRGDFGVHQKVWGNLNQNSKILSNPDFRFLSIAEYAESWFFSNI
jgi:hypothetical protein